MNLSKKSVENRKTQLHIEKRTKNPQQQKCTKLQVRKTLYHAERYQKKTPSSTNMHSIFFIDFERKLLITQDMSILCILFFSYMFLILVYKAAALKNKKSEG